MSTPRLQALTQPSTPFFFFFLLPSLSLYKYMAIPLFFIYIHLNYGSKTPQLYIYIQYCFQRYIFDEWVTLVGEAGHVQFIVFVVVHAWDDMKFARAPLLQHGFLPPILHKNHLQVKTRIMNLLNSFSFLLY